VTHPTIQLKLKTKISPEKQITKFSRKNKNKKHIFSYVCFQGSLTFFSGPATLGRGHKKEHREARQFLLCVFCLFSLPLANKEIEPSAGYIYIFRSKLSGKQTSVESCRDLLSSAGEL
jgi:hypothetical protein